MTAITTAQAGNWSNPATWTGGVVPGDGNTVTLNHSVTVDVPVIVGTSPATAGTAAIAWGTANVVLTINANLTLRGDIIPKDDFTLHDLVVQGAGTTVTFDATQAAAPSTTNYCCRLWNDNVGWRWKANGTLSQPCVIQSAAGAGNGRFDPNGHVGYRINCAYTHFIRIGDATNLGFSVYLGGGSGPEFTLANCVIDTCGTFQAKNGTTTSILSITNCVFKNGLNTGGNGDLQTGLLETATSPGTIDNTYFAGNVEAPFGAMALTNTVFAGALISDSDSACTTCQYNLIAVDAAVLCPGTVDHCYVIDLNSANSNPQGLKPNAFNHNITYTIFESTYPTFGAGDLIINGNGSAFSYGVNNCILLPAASDGTSPGKLCSLIAAASQSHFSINHNTVVANWPTGSSSESGVVQYGESGGGAAGEVTSLKSNLVWSSVVATGRAAVLTRLTGTLQNEVAAANADYNATWNGANDGTDPTGYVSGSAGSIFSSGTAGVHDKVLTSDPFVDKTRNFAKWGASIGGAGTVADTLALLRKRLDWTDGAYNANNGATIQALVAWVSAGFQVTAASLKNAGHDGVTIGAMPFAATGIIPALMILGFNPFNRGGLL